MQDAKAVGLTGVDYKAGPGISINPPGRAEWG